MPSFRPFTSFTARNAVALFDIRLEHDFLVFRGSEHESSGQLLKGVVAVCVPAPIKIEDIRLRLTGTQRLAWSESKATSQGLSHHKVDRTITILQHQWPPFWGTPGKSVILEKGNYEFPFELLLPGNTAESVEGLQEAGITYKLKATIARGKLAHDLHAYKHVRVVRTLESSALELLHAMSVENIWPNKVEYSIAVPQKAIVFGSAVSLEMRFCPLLKGLEVGDVTIRLMEIHDVVLQGISGHATREYKQEREAASWVVPVSREEHWQDVIEDTGQEGWMVDTTLDLPRKLGRCMQDVNVQGIKIRHKLKLVVALKNPDGHVSELRATLPVTIFISPNIPLDEDGNLIRPTHLPDGPLQTNGVAPPGYGEHVLDQLYDSIDLSGLQTPAAQSGVGSPLYSHSRAGSNDSLAATAGSPVPPAALSSRLQNVSLDPSRRDSFLISSPPASGVNTPYGYQVHGIGSGDASLPPSPPLSRQGSSGSHSGNQTPEHTDYPELSELCKVPSYATAMKSTKVTALSGCTGSRLPDYRAATSAPQPQSPAHNQWMDLISPAVEVSHEGESQRLQLLPARMRVA